MSEQKVEESKCSLPECKGPNIGLLKFKVCKIRKTKEGELLVRFKLTLPCSVSSSPERTHHVVFLALEKNTAAPSAATAQDIKADCNIITGKVRLVPKQTYQVVSYTFNPTVPLGFTAGAVDRLISLP